MVILLLTDPGLFPAHTPCLLQVILSATLWMQHKELAAEWREVWVRHLG